ncbi:MAG: protein arginine kinase [bacterium]|nr:protein arginine kinase [bacterium]
MEISDLTRRTGEWLQGTGPLAEVVISSRIRLARNLDRHKFLSRADDAERREIYQTLTNRISETELGTDALLVDMDETDPLDRQLLVERHLISKQHAEAEGCRGAVISPDERRALMINEEDHLRIQCLRSGLQLESLWEEISGIDDLVEQRVPYAFDEQFGYLTACPTNVGTGIRVSVMLHLPGLKMTGEIERVFRAARDMRLAIRGLHGEGTDAIGDFFQVSNQTTLGQSEEEIVREFGGDVIRRLVEYEMTARDTLAKQQPYQLDDKIYRAFGILSNVRMIGTDESLYLLSNLRLGVQMQRFKSVGLETLNELFLLTQRAHLQSINGGTLDGAQRAVARAELFRKKLSPSD